MGSSKKHKSKKKHKSSHVTSASPISSRQDSVSPLVSPSFGAEVREEGGIKISLRVPSITEEREEEPLVVQYPLEDIARARMDLSSSHKRSKKSKKKHHHSHRHSAVDILKVTGLDDVSDDDETIIRHHPPAPPPFSIGGKKFPPDYKKDDTPSPNSFIVSINLDQLQQRNNAQPPGTAVTQNTSHAIETVPIKSESTIVPKGTIPVKKQESVESLVGSSVGDKKKKKKKKHKHKNQVVKMPNVTKTKEVVSLEPVISNVASHDISIETDDTTKSSGIYSKDHQMDDEYRRLNEDIKLSPASSTTSSLQYAPGSTKLPPNALKYFLRHLHNQIQRNDPEGVFSEPVTDEIAPGYSTVIKQPMDLQTMYNKIEMNEYPSVNEFKEDFEVMCSNAMTYNSPETMYYQTAKKLLNLGLKMIQKELSIRPDIQHGLIPSSIPLSSSIDYSSSYLCRINLSMLQPYEDTQAIIDVGSETMEPIVDQSHLTQLQIGFDNDPHSMDYTEPEPMEEEDTVEESILSQVDEATKSLKERHLSSSPAELSYLNQKDGRTFLNILNPHSVVSSLPVDLTALSEKVKAGQSASAVLTSELPIFKATPVSYLMYGPFGSFAPAYDTAFATLTKHDSSLLLSTYGSELGINYANSLQQFVKGCGSFASEMGNAILNSLTSGRHSKLQETIKQQEEIEKQTTKSVIPSKVDDNSEYTKDTKETSETVEQLSPGIPEVQSGIVQDTMNKTSTLIANLDGLQRERLGKSPSLDCQGHFTLPSPSQLEKATASNITSHLVSVASQVQPMDLVSVNTLHKAMGISQPNTIPPSTSTGSTDVIPSSL